MPRATTMRRRNLFIFVPIQLEFDVDCDGVRGTVCLIHYVTALK